MLPPWERPSGAPGSGPGAGRRDAARRRLPSKPHDDPDEIAALPEVELRAALVVGLRRVEAVSDGDADGVAEEDVVDGRVSLLDAGLDPAPIEARRQHLAVDAKLGSRKDGDGGSDDGDGGADVRPRAPRSGLPDLRPDPVLVEPGADAGRQDLPVDERRPVEELGVVVLEVRGDPAALGEEEAPVREIGPQRVGAVERRVAEAEDDAALREAQERFEGAARRAGVEAESV